MITVIRSATVAPGKLADAITFAKETAALSSRLTGNEVRLVSALAGAIPTIAWMSTYKDLASYETGIGKLMGSQEWLTALKKCAGVFVDGSIRNEIWRDL